MAKFKLVKHSLTCLMLIMPDGSKIYRYSIDGATTSSMNIERGIKRLEATFLQNCKSGPWERAILYEIATRQPLYYYGAKYGAKRMGEEEFKKLFDRPTNSSSCYNFYFIPNDKARQNGLHKIKPQFNKPLEDISLYFDPSTMASINVYRGKKLFYKYYGGQKLQKV